ncbi:hypothetical protein BHE74_00054873 [Ensete ventricosum]|uniref:Uncharacterized protein n=1 Tax=Ensete ventricosum TaxID=4639 RepID=A0A445MLI4_ENSVE|nr:hypothetical protein BHE74_00054873 [Ensete ventricosum]RZR75134.1 hypothetical protein BHM03_00050059 [Ensete ventricosum]
MAVEGSESGGNSDGGEKGGHNNVSCGCGMTLWLQVETVAGCDCNRERRATERTTVAEEHSVSMERETAADNV